jgi:hypothetical protein
MALRPRSTALLVVSLLLLAGVAWLATTHYRLKAAVEKYKQQLRASGEKLSIMDVLPRHPLPEKDGTLIFREATALLRTGRNILETNTPPTMRLTAPGRALVGFAQPDIREEGVNSWEDLRAHLAAQAEALDLLRELVERPNLDFHLDYTSGPMLTLPHLTSLRRAAHHLSAAALYDLHRGDAASASTNVMAMLAMAQGMRDEPLSVSQFVRISIVHMALAANWELLQSTNVPADVLAELQRVWSQLAFVDAGEQSLLMGRAMTQGILEDMHHSAAALRNMTRGPNRAAPRSGYWMDDALDMAKRAGYESLARTKEAQWRLTWSLEDELRSLKGWQVLIDAMRLAKTTRAFAPALLQQGAGLTALGFQEGSIIGKIDSGEADLRTFFSEWVAQVSRLLSLVLTAEAAKQMAITAIALKRYQLETGTYPVDLNELVPKFMSELPRDPVDGQPIRYRPAEGQSFMLYSIGADGKDDGGDPARTDKKRWVGWYGGRDWVWPQPASVAEVTAFFKTNSVGRQFAEDFAERYGLAETNTISTNSIK